MSLLDGDAGVMGHAAGHHSLGAFDDALVLWCFGDAGARCGHRWLHTHTHTRAFDSIALRCQKWSQTRMQF